MATRDEVQAIAKAARFVGDTFARAAADELTPERAAEASTELCDFVARMVRRLAGDPLSSAPKPSTRRRRPRSTKGTGR
jgi:triphosphoribosyl-dephospho-CoA synthetase